MVNTIVETAEQNLRKCREHTLFVAAFVEQEPYCQHLEAYGLLQFRVSARGRPVDLWDLRVCHSRRAMTQVMKMARAMRQAFWRDLNDRFKEKILSKINWHRSVGEKICEWIWWQGR